MTRAKKNEVTKNMITPARGQYIRDEYDKLEDTRKPPDQERGLKTVRRLSEETGISYNVVSTIIGAYVNDYWRGKKKEEAAKWRKLTPEMKAYLIRLDPEELTQTEMKNKFNRAFSNSDLTPLSAYKVNHYRLNVIQSL